MKIWDKLTVRSVVVLLMVVGCLGLALVDERVRPAFSDLAKVGVGGYLGQLIPESK